MKPSTIQAIGFKLVGGKSDGSFVVHFPKSLSEIVVALNEAMDFLKNSDTRWIEMQMLNREGKKELRTLYKAQEDKSKDESDFDPDPYIWGHYA